MQVIVIGGGAAGFFGAIALAEANPAARVTILERGTGFLQKVKISGGGRCNVTHACFEVRELVRNYPRGARELAGPFTRFGPSDTVAWFERRGVHLKTESDGRMFPDTDQSQTIIDCLWQAAKKSGIELRTSCRVDTITPLPNQRWRVVTAQEVLEADRILLTTGSSESIWRILGNLGHKIVPPVPSLFTFNIRDSRIHDLPGISVPEANLSIPAFKIQSQGPLLITHWGLSGPAVLKLSAWAARHLQGAGYAFQLMVNWAGSKSPSEVVIELETAKRDQARRNITGTPLFGFPSRLWQTFCKAAGIAEAQRWADLNKKQQAQLVQEISSGIYNVSGKSTFKEEFVTAGGVDLKEVNFKTFESKLLPGLFFAGEVLDIDAVTGGFNFQAAWTGGWIAGNSIAAIP